MLLTAKEFGHVLVVFPGGLVVRFGLRLPSSGWVSDRFGWYIIFVDWLGVVVCCVFVCTYVCWARFVACWFGQYCCSDWFYWFRGLAFGL